MSSAPLAAPSGAAGPGSPAAPGRLEKTAIFLLVAFLLVFPKGGIKLGGVPLTWGYIGLGLAFAWLPLAMLLGRSASVRSVRLVVPALLVPFQLTIWWALLANGTSGMGFAISLIVSFFFVPLMLVLVLGIHLDRMDLGFLFRLVRWGVFAVAVYGIFLFFYRLKTGAFIEVPFLTVNAGDVGGLEDKYIDRGGVFKLISTYNNGNIYGVSMLTLLPLYAWLERSVPRQLVVKFSLLLTLSRTVWAGLILFEILHRVFVKRISLRAVAVLLASLLAVLAGLWYALDLMGWDAGHLFDRRLGGRVGQLAALDEATVLPRTRFRDVLEIVYLGILHNFGIVGLAAYLLAMAGPLLLYAARVLPFAGTEYKRALATGLAIYLFVSMSDGALLFIPVMVFFWFVASLLLSDNPSFRALEPPAEGGRRAPAAA